MERQDGNVYPGAEEENIDHISKETGKQTNGPQGNALNVQDSTRQPETPVAQAGDSQQAGPGNRPVKDGVLELVYGVLFDPARTFAGFVQQPPVTAAVIAVVVLNLAEALMAMFTTPQYLGGVPFPGIPDLDTTLRAMLPLLAIGVFIIGFVKWFFMAGLLHLLAELYGGRGAARGVFAVYGLAGLPAALMIPVELLSSFSHPGIMVNLITVIVRLAVLIWSVVLLVIGIREVHGFGTGRAVLTVFTPVMAFIVMLVIGLIMVVSLVATLPDNIMY